jgi:hypothetical protein
MSDGVRETSPAAEAAYADDRRAPEDRAARGRRLLAPIRLAGLRILRRPARTVVIASGVALATATLVAVSSSSLIVRDRELGKALSDVPPAQRSFRVDEFGLAFTASPAVRRRAVDALALLTPRHPVHTVALRTLRFRTQLVLLSGVEQAGRWITLTSGRLPGQCRPKRCEVLEIGTAKLPRALSTPGLRIVPVGRATLSVPAVLGDFAQPEEGTLLVTSDVAGLSSLPALQSIFRTESWVVPLSRGDIRAWEVDRLLAREAQAQALLETADPASRLTAPDDAITGARRQGRIGAQRMLLVGGEVAALVLGFAVLAAVGLRRTLLAEWRRLEERGARRSQLWLFVVTETGVAALAGVVAGAVAGALAAMWASSRSGVGAGAALSHAILAPWTLMVVAAVWLVATIVLVVSVRAPREARAGPVRVGDVVALGAIAVAAVAASRGNTGADSLAANDSSVTLLLLFPALLSLGVALLAARLLSPGLRLAERVARGSRPSVRLALLALARAPSRTAVAVAFLLVSVGLALLATAYRATLDGGARDEAAYQVPLDFSVTEGSRLVLPLEAAPLGRYRSLARDVGAYPVVRRFADVPSLGTQPISPVLLGLDPAAVSQLHGWRADFGDASPGKLARLLGAEGPVQLAGAPLPAGTTGLALPARVRGADVELAVAVATPSQKIVTVPLSAAGSQAAGRGRRVPAGGRVVALELSLTKQAEAALAHREAENAVGQGPVGMLELGPLVAYAGSRRLGSVTSWTGWLGRQGASRLPGNTVRVRYALTAAQTALFRPRQPTDGHPLAFVVSPDVARAAGPGGVVTLELGDQTVTGRVASVAKRFPGTADGGGSFVVADESHLQTALDADAPGTGTPGEVWLAAPHDGVRVAEALRAPPFAPLVVTSRRGIEHQLRSDPLARGIELTLGAGALLALVLAVGGLWLTVLGEVSDEQGELYDLETQGATPGQLRGQLRLRAAILAVLGVVGGVVLGVILTREVVRLVSVSASGAAPVPPLAGSPGWTAAGAGLLALVVAGAILVEVTVRRAFRGSSAHRLGEVA